MPKPAPQTLLKSALDASLRGSQPALNPLARLNVGVVLAVVLILLGLSGCGPGTGGTGVGPVTSSASAAMAYSGVATVASPSGVTTSASVPPPVVTLKLEPEGVQLQGSCFNFTSNAPLAPAVSTLTVVPGTYQRFTTLSGQTATSSVPANLVLQFSSGQSDSLGVSLSVRTTGDAILFGPVTLQRADTASVAVPAAAGPAAICP